MKSYIKITINGATKRKNRENFLKLLRAFEGAGEMPVKVRELAEEVEEIFWTTDTYKEGKCILHFKYEEKKASAEYELCDVFAIYIMEELSE